MSNLMRIVCGLAAALVACLALSVGSQTEGAELEVPIGDEAELIIIVGLDAGGEVCAAEAFAPRPGGCHVILELFTFVWGERGLGCVIGPEGGRLGPECEAEVIGDLCWLTPTNELVGPGCDNHYPEASADDDLCWLNSSNEWVGPGCDNTLPGDGARAPDDIFEPECPCPEADRCGCHCDDCPPD